MAETKLGEVPYRSPMFDERGNLTNIWAKWFRDLYLRVGGGSATSIGDISGHPSQTDNPHSTTFTQAVAADSGTDITASEAETLTDGSNADSLHTHVGLGGSIGDEETAFFICMGGL